MANFTLSPEMGKNRVFIVKRSELEGRLDPASYHPERRGIIDKLKATGRKLEKLKFLTGFGKSIVKELPENPVYLGLENIESHTGDYLPTKEKTSISSALEFKQGQVLFPKLRPYLNKVHFAEFDGVCSTEFHVLDSNKISNKFLSYYLRTKIILNQTKYLMSGNTLPRLQTEDIQNLLIPVLDAEEEQKVIAIMDYAFAQKKQNEAEAEKILAGIDDYLLAELGIVLPELSSNNLKDRIFITSFKKITGQRCDPTYHRLNYEKFINSLINSPFKPLKLKDIITFLDYGLMPTQDYAFTESEGLPMIRVTNIGKDGYIDMSKVEFIKFDTPKLRDKIVKEHDILMVQCGNTTGKCAMVTKEFVGHTYGSFSFAIRANTNFVNQFYLFHVLNSKIVQEQLNRSITISSVRPNTSKPEVENFLIPVPPLEKQQEIAEHISAIRQQAQNLKAQTQAILTQANKEIEEILLGNN